MPPEPLSLYDEERLSIGIGKPPDLAGGHLLSHVKQEPTVVIFDAPHQPAKLAEKTGLFPGAAPDNIVGAFTLRKVGEHRRFFTVIEEVIKRDFPSASHFLECFNGRDGMGIFHARDISEKKSRAPFHVPL